MNFKLTLALASILASVGICSAQVDIDNYSVSGTGQVLLSIEGESSKYYLLHAEHSDIFEWATSMTMGLDGTMVISEPGTAYPLENYTITAHDIADPDDYDGDGIDDVTEFNTMPTDAPINFAESVDFLDGATSVPDAATFLELATVNDVGWAPFLDGQLYVKFGILDRDTDEPKIYFINSNTHVIHANFFSSIGATVTGDDGSGEIVFNPNTILPNGVIGSYSFNFSFGDAYDFVDTQRTYELLLANMPFLQANMNHFIGAADENNHLNNYADDFVGARFDVVLESVVFAEIDYIPFHEAEGYGLFRHMTFEETPGSRDIVLYDALPNSLPRVGGIMTSVVQTPLSHVNLRAIQDNVPNAYIANPLDIDSIASLIGEYIYFKVENETFQIREATLAEVDAWYEDIRPTEPQYPIRDLSVTEILPLDDITFEMSAAFGAKCSNVATMRTFGFPETTIPDGFGIPFYFYDEFMLFNGFYEEAQVMIDNESFQNDLDFRIERLEQFRDDIKDAPMPEWMMDALEEMHQDFPVGTAVRCRSSTNNEDLPGFSGAGLYTSKTQHLDEGHISKSIKQIYASMWNFRAYEERDFYRVDHFLAAMGLLCHPNFQEEQSNGVGISIDPLYETEGTYYLNTQVGESLITNPDANSVPEEILLYQDPEQAGGYLVLNLSNLAEPGELIMDQVFLDEMRDYLTVIHDEFAILYDLVGVEGFGMDIEYKVTAENHLAIKQARPWVSFWSEIKANSDLGVTAVTDPPSSSDLGSDELVTATIANQGLTDMSDFDVELYVDDVWQETLTVSDIIEPFSSADFQFSVPQDFSAVGDYDIMAIVTDLDDEYGNNDTLNVVLSKVHALDGALAIGNVAVACNNEVIVDVILMNPGETTITSGQIEVVVNGLAIEILDITGEVPFLGQVIVPITVTENLVAAENEITFNLLTVNGVVDGEWNNNTALAISEMDSGYDIITLIINADDYPAETSWELVDEGANQVVSSGGLSSGDEFYSEDICVNYGSCFTLYFYDSWGDGICCSYGFGNFRIENADGDILVENDGNFGSEAIEAFCPDGSGCGFTADVNVGNTTGATADDGTITIYTDGGVGPFQYSINGGLSFSDSNTFTDLEPGTYEIYVEGGTGACSYETTVTLDACLFTSADVVVTHASSVVSIDGSIEIIPTSGVAPYQYSIDGGQNFFPNNLFENLPVGPYNIVVMDAVDACEFEVDAPILLDSDTGVDDVTEASAQDITLYPNPTQGNINIEVHSFSGETVNIEIYDQLGRIIQTDSLVAEGNTKTTISLDGYGPGTYLVRCYTATYRKSFKVIKL